MGNINLSAKIILFIFLDSFIALQHLCSEIPSTFAYFTSERSFALGTTPTDLL